MEKKSRELLAPHVEEELMDYILHEPVNVGDKIPNELQSSDDSEAKTGTVLWSTVRETVKSLVSKGVLEVRRGSGTYVIGTNRLEDDPLGLSGFTDKYELALDLCNVRLMLEPEIAMLASENATDEEKAELKRLCDEVENLYLAGENHLQKDVEFHTYIARCSKNKVIEKLVPIIQSAVITFVNLTHRQLKDETIDTHRAITDAILNGDSAGAKYAMIMHLNYNRQMILKKQAKAQQKNE